jgi:hypothetical protein
MTPNKERYYLHGDAQQSESDETVRDKAEHTASFYCSACDAFHIAEHFSKPHGCGHNDAGAARYERKLKNFDRRRQWHKDRCFRPAGAANVFTAETERVALQYG